MLYAHLNAIIEVMKLQISTSLFKGLQKLLPRKGEKRLGFFRRQFKGVFTKAQEAELCTFINANGFRPMEPIWRRQGCYILAAADTFENHPQRDRYLSALMLADLVWAYPKLELVLLQKIDLTLKDRANRYKSLKALLKTVKEKEARHEKQIRLLARNLKNRNRARLQANEKPSARKTRYRDNDVS